MTGEVLLRVWPKLLYIHHGHSLLISDRAGMISSGLQLTSTPFGPNPFAGYAREERPLATYAGLAGLFNAAFAGFLLAARGSGRTIPERVRFGDLLLLGVATHKLSRLLAKDLVTSFLRAPFTQFEGLAGSGEVNEKPRGTGLQLALGELLTCPYCLGQWVAAFFAYGLVLKPNVTRLVAGSFTTITVADFLHYGYEAARKWAEQPQRTEQPGSAAQQEVSATGRSHDAN